MQQNNSYNFQFPGWLGRGGGGSGEEERGAQGQVPQDGGPRREDEEAVLEEGGQAPDSSGPRQDHGGQVGQVLSVFHVTFICTIVLSLP